MSDLSDWLKAQGLIDLARFANKPPRELELVIVTDAMKEAAMEYVHSLYDAHLSSTLLEEVFRIMAVLQPKHLEFPAELPAS